MGKECRYKDTSGKKLDAANPQTTGELPFFLLWEVLRDAKAPRWPRRGVFASGAGFFLALAITGDEPFDRVQLRFWKRAVRAAVVARCGPLDQNVRSCLAI